MTKTAYTDNAIFNNPQLNAICDDFLQKLVDKFASGEPGGEIEIYSTFILSGRAAAIIQGEVYPGATNITFETSSEIIFQYLQGHIEEFYNCNAIALADRILFYPFGFYFEIWFSPTPMVELEFENIYVQETSKIPLATL